LEVPAVSREDHHARRDMLQGRIPWRPLVGMTARCISSGAEVQVMAVANGFAMVRRPGCIPFVEHVGGLASVQEVDDAG